MLNKKYQDEWKNHIKKMSHLSADCETLANPLLIDVPKSYFDADCKVMIFGQETNGWEGAFPHKKGVAHILKTYSDFYNSDHCYSYGGQFWNGVSKFRDAMAEKLRPSGKTLSIVWNNLIKIGKAEGKGAPSEDALLWGDKWFDVISHEMEVLKPNIVVFFTGPNYDKYISRIFNGATFECIADRNERQLARVKSSMLPVDSIRTYHPNYLWRNDFYGYLNDIIGAIKNY